MSFPLSFLAGLTTAVVLGLILCDAQGCFSPDFPLVGVGPSVLTETACMDITKNATHRSGLRAVVGLSLIVLGLATGLAWPRSVAVESTTGNAVHVHELMPWDVLGHMHFSTAPARRGCKSELLPVTNDPKSLARCANLRHLPASV